MLATNAAAATSADDCLVFIGRRQTARFEIYPGPRPGADENYPILSEHNRLDGCRSRTRLATDLCWLL